MRNIKLTLEYDGTHFNGWQIQAKPRRTVQEELTKACSRILKEKITVVGSGRTDSGVHALGQVANFKTRSKMPAEEIFRALNANLPDDVVVLKAEDVRSSFHAQHSAKRKTYRYTILNRSVRAAQQRHFCLFYHYSLNLRRMRTAATALIGKKDFKSFQASDAARKEQSTIRRIKKLTIVQKGDYIHIDIEADGFLYKMVRNIVGTLLEVGSGKLPPGSIKTILKARNRTFAGKTAPAKGLCLLEVAYRR
jgi:tRNA pseudouridine38-40 synthase